MKKLTKLIFVTYRHTYRQTDGGYLIGPSPAGGPKLVKMTKNGKNGHFGDPENPEKNGSYQKRTDIMMCLDQTYQENILDV